MKNSQRLCMIGVLTLLLSTTGLAGDIHTGIAPPPPDDPPFAAVPVDPSTPQVIQNQEGASETIADIALSLAQTILTVF
jgi:hypothetical protein